MGETEKTCKTFLVEREFFNKRIGYDTDVKPILSFVGEMLISGYITYKDNYLCSFDIWTDSHFIELYAVNIDKKLMKKLFKGRWAE